MAVKGIDLGKYRLGWHDSTDDYVYTPHKGLNEKTVSEISDRKSEPDWMTKFRLNALKRFERYPARYCGFDVDAQRGRLEQWLQRFSDGEGTATAADQPRWHFDRIT